MTQNKIALAIHGGAGTILRSEMSPELEQEYRDGIKKALLAGWEILQNGGSALDAVETTVTELENFPLFNAGKGSVFTHDGKNEMDAAIMDGKELRAGAVAFIKNVKNPIKLARLVMEKTEHVLLAGDGANEFARELNVEFETDEYFFTEHRYQQLLKARAAGQIQLDHTGEVESQASGVESQELRVESRESEVKSDKNNPQTPNPKSQIPNPKSPIPNPKSLGTVGAVACDINGNLAAATSTGGMTNKKFGRIGDTPVIGSGTYAENSSCAVSCTGHGEFFMLGVTAFDVAARMKYKNIDLEEAAQETITRLTEIGGEGGLIAVDALGNVTLPFNSEGMYRGFVKTDGQINIEIYKD